MATTNAKATSGAQATHPAPSQQVESFSGDLNLTLTRSQWQIVVGALSIASGEVARTTCDYERIFGYNALINLIGADLGMTTMTANAGESPPRTRAAFAS